MLKTSYRAVILAVMLFAAVMMLAALLLTAGLRSVASEIPVIAGERESDPGYIVRAYNGHIAVFCGDITDSPAIETTIEIDSLRAVDRDKLLAGIAVTSYDDVLKLLEDFGS